MKKIAAWIGIVAGLAILITSSSDTLINKLHQLRQGTRNKAWWAEHNAPNGDLASMAYLDDVPAFNSPKNYHFAPPADTSNKNIDLYIWGDSYLEDVPGFVFSNVNQYHFGRNYFGQLHYKLDTGKRNVLIIESAERFFRPYFSYKTIYNSVSSDSATAKLISTDQPLIKATGQHINQDIEYLLFNYNFLNAPRLWKADINYYLFGRASGNVIISEDGKNLFVKETSLSGHGYSSYEMLPDNTIRWYVQTLNSIYQHYRAEGFDEVYLSIIPSPISILQPGWYNNLIPRIAADTTLHMPLINIYPAFKQHPYPYALYRSGDSHWNNNGFQLWLQTVNEILKTESSKHKK